VARIGEFAGPSTEFGLPLSFIHPTDNGFLKAQFHPLLLDPRLKLTDKQRRDLQREIEELFGLAQLIDFLEQFSGGASE